jgi:hypothetical protein
MAPSRGIAIALVGARDREGKWQCCIHIEPEHQTALLDPAQEGLVIVAKPLLPYMLTMSQPISLGGSTLLLFPLDLRPFGMRTDTGKSSCTVATLWGPAFPSSGIGDGCFQTLICSQDTSSQPVHGGALPIALVCSIQAMRTEELRRSHVVTWSLPPQSGQRQTQTLHQLNTKT